MSGARPGAGAVSHVQRPAPATDSTLTVAPQPHQAIEPDIKYRTAQPDTDGFARGADGSAECQPSNAGRHRFGLECPPSQSTPPAHAILQFGARRTSQSRHPRGTKCKIAQASVRYPRRHRANGCRPRATGVLPQNEIGRPPDGSRGDLGTKGPLWGPFPTKIYGPPWGEAVAALRPAFPGVVDRPGRAARRGRTPGSAARVAAGSAAPRMRWGGGGGKDWERAISAQ